MSITPFTSPTISLLSIINHPHSSNLILKYADSSQFNSIYSIISLNLNTNKSVYNNKVAEETIVNAINSERIVILTYNNNSEEKFNDTIIGVVWLSVSMSSCYGINYTDHQEYHGYISFLYSNESKYIDLLYNVALLYFKTLNILEIWVNCEFNNSISEHKRLIELGFYPKVGMYKKVCDISKLSTLPDNIRIIYATVNDINFIYSSLCDILYAETGMTDFPVEDREPERNFMLESISNNEILIAYVDNIPVGFIQFICSQKNQVGFEYEKNKLPISWVSNISVVSSARGKNIGKYLHEAVQHLYPYDTWLDVWTSNPVSDSFHQKVGFKYVSCCYVNDSKTQHKEKVKLDISKYYN